MRKFSRLLAMIASALKDARIPYVVIGGQAVLVYGDPRFTKDIDITLGVDIDQLDSVKRICASLSLVPKVVDVDAFVKETNVYPVKEESTNIAVDFIFSFSPFERGAMQRAKEVEIENTPVRYASLEDVVILKLVAGRPLDLDDAKSILNSNAGYDEKYILKWLKSFSGIVNRNLVEEYQNLLKVLAKKK